MTLSSEAHDGRQALASPEAKAPGDDRRRRTGSVRFGPVAGVELVALLGDREGDQRGGRRGDRLDGGLRAGPDRRK